MTGEEITYEFLARHADRWVSTNEILRSCSHRFSEYIRRLRNKGHLIEKVRHGKMNYYKLVSTDQRELRL